MTNPYLLAHGSHTTPDEGRCAMEFDGQTYTVSLVEAEKFWAKVSAPHPLSCWEWLGTHDDKGYGRWRRGRRAHRIAYELAHGAFDPSLVVLHECDNPGCVNPRHLRVGTQLDNIADREAKGRGARPPSRAKLTDEQVRQVRVEYERGLTTQAALAERYGVSRGNLSKILNRRLYAHV